MSKQRITFSLPDGIVAALNSKGAPFEMDAGELIQHRLLMSAMGVDLPFNLAATLEVKAGEPEQKPLEQTDFALGDEPAQADEQEGGSANP